MNYVANMNYGEMRAAAEEKAAAQGYAIGTAILFRNQPGRVVDVNAFCFDMRAMPVYVDLDPCGKRPARKRLLVPPEKLRRR